MSSILETAKDYLSRGWQPLPIEHKSKKAGFNGWQNFASGLDDLHKHFNGKPQNIGVLLGKKSNGLTDIDLDAPETLKVAKSILPKTDSIFGRDSKPQSHFLYTSDAPKTIKFSDPIRLNSKVKDERQTACLVEIRSNGGQTVFPASTHESGEAITWAIDGEPAKTDYKELKQRVEYLASVALFARYWSSGNRHDASLALSGFLLRCDWSFDETRNFFKFVCIAANDEETEDRLKAVETTFEALTNNKPATGLPTLAELFDEKIIDAVCKWLELKQSSKHKVINEAQNKTVDGLPKKQTQTDVLLSLIEDIELFHFDREPYAVIEIDNHFENWRVNSRDFKTWLSHQFFKLKKSSPSSQAMKDAINVVCGKALYESNEEKIHVRFAEANGNIYLDLSNATWQIVEISKSGWRIIESKDAPVRFRRAKGMKALPTPLTGKDLTALRPLLNFSDDDFILFAAWLINALRPNYPFPLLILSGREGSAKTTHTRISRKLIDDNYAIERDAPRTMQELSIMANNGWLMTFDNLTNCPQWLSSAFCRLSTGGGTAYRTLFEDDGETIFSAKRPIILNSIEGIVTKSDLLQRGILLELPKIEDDKRTDEKTFWAKFDELHPFILGALLDFAANGLRNIETIKMESSPRMIDFVIWVTACFKDSSIFDAKKFLELYAENQTKGKEITLNDSPLVSIVKRFLEKRKQNNEDAFKGTATELYDELKPFVGDGFEKIAANAQKLSGKLTTIATALKTIGIAFETGNNTDKAKTRFVTLFFTQIDKTVYVASDASGASDDVGKDDNQMSYGEDDFGRNADASQKVASDVESADKPNDGNKLADGADATDATDASFANIFTNAKNNRSGLFDELPEARKTQNIDANELCTCDKCNASFPFSDVVCPKCGFKNEIPF